MHVDLVAVPNENKTRGADEEQLRSQEILSTKQERAQGRRDNNRNQHKK
jgi:hypothetical protein